MLQKILIKTFWTMLFSIKNHSFNAWFSSFNAWFSCSHFVHFPPAGFAPIRQNFIFCRLIFAKLCASSKNDLSESWKAVSFCQHGIRIIVPCKVGKNWLQSIFGGDILYFLFIECPGAFTFLNEYRTKPRLHSFLAQFDIPYLILFVQVTLSHFSKFKIIVGMSLPCFCW